MASTSFQEPQPDNGSKAVTMKVTLVAVFAYAILLALTAKQADCIDAHGKRHKVNRLWPLLFTAGLKYYFKFEI